MVYVCECFATNLVVVPHDGPLQLRRVYPCNEVFHMSEDGGVSDGEINQREIYRIQSRTSLLRTQDHLSRLVPLERALVR